MGKGGNAAKKGKQKVSPAAPADAPPPAAPPPTALSPPAAHHIQHPPAMMDAIEEQESWGGPVGGAEEDSWQAVDHPDDGWAANAPAVGNSNGDLGDQGWEPGVPQAPMPSSPLQAQQYKSGGNRDNENSFYPHQPDQIANAGVPSGQQPYDTWAPENGQWTEDDESDEDDGWDARSGWDGTNSGSDRLAHSATWNRAIAAHSAQSKVTSHTPTSGWQSWGEEARRLPKVTFDSAIIPSSSSTRSKPVLSQQQRSQILDSLLNNPQQTQQPYPIPASAGASHRSAVANNWQKSQSFRLASLPQAQQPERHRSHEHYHGSEKITKSRPPPEDKNPQPQSQSDWWPQENDHDVWGLGDGWNDSHEEEEQRDTMQDAWGRRVHFTPSALRASMLPSSAPSVAPSAVVENLTVNALPQNKLGLSTIPMSKTLSYAYSGTTPSTESEPGRAAMQRITDFQFVESRGEALKDVQRAFYGKRKAADRFHWLFPPDKDERVSSLLRWIHSMSFGIASFGLQKFLQTRERGALIVNAAYRPVHSPSDPAFDWISWNQIQQTMDQILQESVGYYNPAVHIIVFVFLPSPSGNSVAIWRRKLPIPNNIRLAYQAQITQAMASLRKEYPVLVDEYVRKQGCGLDLNDFDRLPLPPEPIPLPPLKKKRKWWKLWLSS